MLSILFATDGRQPARAAADLLTRLADPTNVDVTVLHAFEYGNELFAERYAGDVLAEAGTTFDGAGLPAHLISVDGDPAVAVEKELTQGAHDLTVLGAGNHTWLGRLVFGSVSTHVVQFASTPVLVVHRAPDVEHDRVQVLVGTDGSEAVEHSIDTLIQLTDPNRIEVEVRSVIATPNLAFSAYPGGVVPSMHVEELIREARQAAVEHLETTLERVRSAGFEPSGSLGEGWPGNDLLAHAERSEADLLVVGARGLGAFARLTMGSVSSHVVRHAPATLVAHAPVLRPHPQGPDGDVDQSRYPVRLG
jgi:nucleotide-binding universal stress UspA family protein